MTQLPKAKYRKDYQEPEFAITDVDLTFNLHPTETRVTSVLKVVRQGDHAKPLVLDEHRQLHHRARVSAKDGPTEVSSVLRDSPLGPL